jgi:hypothetical protein
MDLKLLEIRNTAGEVVAEAPLIIHDLGSAIDILRRSLGKVGSYTAIVPLTVLEQIQELPENTERFVTLLIIDTMQDHG